MPSSITIIIFCALTSNTQRFPDKGGSSQTPRRYTTMKSFVFALAACGSWERAVSFTPILPGTRHDEKLFRLRRSSRDIAIALDVSATATTVDVLEDLGLPFGLRETLLTNAQTFSKRIWILDNSGSMALHDGHQVLLDADCTRWAEVEETVNCHAQLSALISAPTDFRLLNPPPNGGPQSFRVGYGRHAAKDSKRVQCMLSRNQPKGKTPLAASIREIRSEVVSMLPKLEAEGTKVAIVIATDGCHHNKQNVGCHHCEATRNEELLRALESLQGLPVCVVIRLCTDYGPLVDFYNGLDESLDLDIDVLDDHKAEAKEVHQHNKWLNYSLVLHRMREMGQQSRLFDLLDERSLTKVEIRNFCWLLYGKRDFPDPDCQWVAFLRELDRLQEYERMQLNPLTREMAPWIDVAELALLE